MKRSLAQSRGGRARVRRLLRDERGAPLQRLELRLERGGPPAPIPRVRARGIPPVRKRKRETRAEKRRPRRRRQDDDDRQSQRRRAEAQTVATATEQTVTFAVEKMTCGTCPITVRKAMEKVEGVKSVDVDFGAKTATVVFDPAVTTPEQIGAASTNAGYPASPTS